MAHHRSRADVLAFRARQNAGFEVDLVATSRGLPDDEVLTATVRRLSLRDPDVLDEIPEALHADIVAGLVAIDPSEARARREIVPSSLLERINVSAPLLASARAYCLAAFVSPPLVADEAEIDEDSDAWAVDDIDPDDQVAIFMAALDPRLASDVFRLASH